jgi:hypothetical protein
MEAAKGKEVRAKRRCGWWPQWLTWFLVGVVVLTLMSVIMEALFEAVVMAPRGVIIVGRKVHFTNGSYDIVS